MGLFIKMKQDRIVYMKSPDGLVHYRTNLTKGSILRISGGEKTRLEGVNWEEIVQEESLLKCKKDAWCLAENNYYLRNDFEWVYEGKRYRTVDTPISEKQLQVIKEGTPEYQMYRWNNFLVFHNGQIWATSMNGNYYPRMYLSRTSKDGKRESKWTHVKYLRNFVKCR